ncbi:hypothetical protein DNHGIG_25800 [Collibacillus ludicampi]|uniref:Phage head morphogenesis domain-containing protein n=1 Tax=Collibacillus ludicampi TaxID=2771369 RepID=A0AAV4LGS4_9BACL|nr:minor capsid protein [Collibacillus ludicampi]GIM47031.1 hypothetical protein DNHGIG_25800 [Collibacillus ludicampi]
MGKITNGLRKVLTTFINWLPEGANKQNPHDVGHVAKTSPWLFDYDVFRLNWEKVTILREIDEMLRSDPRIKRANHVFASTAVRRGLTVKVTSEVSEDLAQKAQDLINLLMRSAQINSKLLPWARSLLKDGELYLNPIIDINKRLISDIKNLPAITMQRNEDITGRFPDLNDAFRQIDPVSREIVHKFPLWAVNHIRYDHEPGQLYGNSQYLACRAIWKKLVMTEEDLVVRRRTRAVPRRLHIVGNKDNPGTWDEVKKYKEFNKLDNPKRSTITTDYFGNGLTDIKDLNADAQLDHIKDIEYLQEQLMMGTGVPLHILGFGKNVNRDIVEDQKKQFEEDVQELRDLLEYGDEAPYSGLRAIFDLQLTLQGIDPSLVSYNFIWSDTNNDTLNDKVDRVIKLRSAQPDPLISRELALNYIARDFGLDSQESVKAEIEKIKQEMAEDRTEQQTEAGALNPMKPSTSPTDRYTTQASGKPTTDSKTYNPLHGDKKVIELEKWLADEVRSYFRRVFRTMKKNGIEARIKKLQKLSLAIKDSTVTCKLSERDLAWLDPHGGCGCFQCQMINDAEDEFELSDVVEQQVIEEFDQAWQEHEDSLKITLLSAYAASGKLAFNKIAEEVEDENVGVSISFDFVHSGVKEDLERFAGYRINGIEETTRNLLRRQLAKAYENGETVNQWIERIQSVLDIPDWRAEMIARTEISWAFNRAKLGGYIEAGVSKVRYLAVIDKRTCPTCKEDHEKEFNIHDAPSLPRHPRCRCTTVAVF